MEKSLIEKLPLMRQLLPTLTFNLENHVSAMNYELDFTFTPIKVDAVPMH